MVRRIGENEAVAVLGEGTGEHSERELSTEYVLYRNICWTLLEGCGYEGDIEDLMDGNAEKWKASDFRNRLEEYMGQDMANAFFLESCAFCRSLRKLIKKLKIDDKLNKLTPCALVRLIKCFSDTVY